MCDLMERERVSGWTWERGWVRLGLGLGLDIYTQGTGWAASGPWDGLINSTSDGPNILDRHW